MSASHPFVLRSIRLRNFKSIAKARVETKPLTIIVGANSSGKSTLIQSLLALAQAASVDTDPGMFPLNGKLVRLGTYEETKRFQSLNDEGIALEVELEGITSRALHTVRGPTKKNAAGSNKKPLRVRFGIELVLSPKKTSGRALVSSVSAQIATIVRETNYVTGVEIYGLTVTTNGEQGARANTTSESEARLFAATGSVVEAGEDARTVDWAEMSGGFPSGLFQTVTKFDLLFGQWWRQVDSLYSSSAGTVDFPKRHFDLPFLKLASERYERGVQTSRRPSSRSEVFESLIKSCSESIAAGLENSDGVIEILLEGRHLHRLRAFAMKDFIELNGRFGPLAEETFRRLLEGEMREVVKMKLRNDVRAKESVIVTCDSATTSAVWKDVRRFFSSDLKYLGPIREAPNVLYDEGVNSGDIGVSGEHTAAILLTLGNVETLVPTSDGAERRMSLSAGVDYWLGELGLVRMARAWDRGRIGIGLQVIPMNADHVVDLTSVGVGVSQLLPVIVLCLLAKPGQVVILEQPELHLHPLMQQKLADFLLACTRSGRQIIVETHSEHLVNRLRLRVAEDTSSSTGELVGLLFAEQIEGETRYRSSTVNALGGLDSDWPTGFLDVGSNDIGGLLHAALQKRKSLQDPPD